MQNTVNEQDAAFADARNLLLLLALVSFVIAVICTWLLVEAIAKPVGRVTEALSEISEGDLEREIHHNSKDEIGQMATAFGQMRNYLRGLAGAAEEIADGDLSTDIEPKSEKDTLGNAFKNMKEYLHEMAGAAGEIAEGDFTVDVRPKSENDALGNAFKNMTDNLRPAIGGVTQAAEQLGNLSREMASTSEQAGRTVGEIASAFGAPELVQRRLRVRAVRSKRA